jgi:hypothetical protein
LILQFKFRTLFWKRGEQGQRESNIASGVASSQVMFSPPVLLYLFSSFLAAGIASLFFMLQVFFSLSIIGALASPLMHTDEAAVAQPV